MDEIGVDCSTEPGTNGSVYCTTAISRSLPTYFHFECPTCGRQLKARMRYLGKNVTCPSCHREVTADPFEADHCESSLERAARLLRQLGGSQQNRCETNAKQGGRR
jgi:predicted RNA-binding Zn-ribbon protein involved in translation (DUF1610 family)